MPSRIRIAMCFGERWYKGEKAVVRMLSEFFGTNYMKPLPKDMKLSIKIPVLRNVLINLREAGYDVPRLFVYREPRYVRKRRSMFLRQVQSFCPYPPVKGVGKPSVVRRATTPPLQRIFPPIGREPVVRQRPPARNMQTYAEMYASAWTTANTPLQRP